ncbi:hypothetical protein ACVMAJ_000250 [Bradyrhizobium sp. USDA 4448]
MDDATDRFQRIVEARATIAELEALVTPAAVRAERDALYFWIRENFFAAHSDNDAAIEIERGLGRYAASAWLRDRSALTCPPRLVGTLNGAFWRLMHLSPKPLRPSTIRALIARQRQLR